MPSCQSTAQKSAFSRTAAPKDGDDIAALRGHGNPFEDFERTKALLQIFDAQRGVDVRNEGLKLTVVRLRMHRRPSFAFREDATASARVLAVN